jgi:tetratricopeptide (TPR) repeat protein
MLFDLGRWDELLDKTARVIEEDAGTSQVTTMAASFRALVLARRGQVGEAANLIDDFLPRARSAGDPQVLSPALLAAAVAEQAAERPERVRLLLEELEAARRGFPWPRGYVAPEATRLALAAGRRDLAERLLEGADDSRAPRYTHAVVSGRALLAEHDGAFEEALALFADAAERWAMFGFPLERAHALAGQARCLSRLGRASEAEEPLGQARELFGRLGVREPQPARGAASGGTALY